MSKRNRLRDQDSRGVAHAPKRRKYGLEALERRLMLSGTHDAALIAAIDAALSTTNTSGLSAFATRLDDSSALGRQLPLAGAGLGANYNPGTQLNSLLSRLAPSYPSLAALAAGLEGSPGIADGVNVTATRDNPDDLELDVHFNTTTTVVVPVAGVYGINLAVGGSLSLATTLDFQMTIGAYWDSSTSSAVFYINGTNEQLQVSSSVSSVNLNSTGSVGVVDLNVSGGSAALSPAFTFNLSDPNPAVDQGRLTLAELNSTPVPTLVVTTVGQAAATSLTVNPSPSYGAARTPPAQPTSTF